MTDNEDTLDELGVKFEKEDEKKQQEIKGIDKVKERDEIDEMIM